MAGRCFSDFSMAVVNHNDQGNLEKEVFIRAHSCRVHDARAKVRKLELEAKSSQLKPQARRKENALEMMIGFETSKPSPSYTLCSAKPHFLNLLNILNNWDQLFKYLSLWGRGTFHSKHIPITASDNTLPRLFR